MSARPERGDVVISTKFFTHSGLKQCGSSPFALAASWHRHKNGSARSRSSPLWSTRKNSCSSPILRIGSPTLPASGTSPLESSSGRDRFALVGPSTFGVSASISTGFSFFIVDQTHWLRNVVRAPSRTNGWYVCVRGAFRPMPRSSVGKARVRFVVRRGGLLLQALQQPLQVVQEYVCGVPAIAVPYHHPEREKVLPVLGKRVSGHLPAALAHPPRDVVGRVPFHLVPKLEGEDGQLRAVGYELKGTELRDGGGGVGRYVPALLLDAPVALEAQPEKVVVLRHDLRARTREVQGECRHISSEVVHPKDEILRQGLRISPDGPADAGVNPAVLVARGVDRSHPLQAKVPDEIRIYERRDHSPRCPVHVDRHVQARAPLQIVEGIRELDNRFVRTVEGGTADGDNADGVLVAELGRLFAVEVETVPLHWHVTGLHLEVVAELLPADLDVYAHDHVRPICALAGRASPLLPAALEGQSSEHGCLAGTRGRASRGRIGVGRVPKAAEHVDAAHLKLGRLRVLVLVDHVLVEAFGHQLLGLRLHVRCYERREVQTSVAVEHELIVDDLVGHVGRHRPVRQAVLGNGRALAVVEGIHRELLTIWPLARDLRVQWHRSSPFR